MAFQIANEISQRRFDVDLNTSIQLGAILAQLDHGDLDSFEPRKASAAVSRRARCCCGAQGQRCGGCTAAWAAAVLAEIAVQAGGLTLLDRTSAIATRRSE